MAVAPRKERQLTAAGAVDGAGLHERVLGAMDHPTFIVGGTLPDHRWVLRTDDNFGRRGTDIPIDFAVPVAPGPVYLTDPECAHDLLTAKLYVVHGLGAADGWLTSANTMRASYRALLDLIRWRNEVGLRRMSELAPTWFTLYREALRGGRPGLLPYEERALAYVDEVREGRSSLPIVGKVPRLRSDLVAARLGFLSSLQIPRRAWAHVLRLLADTDPAAYRNSTRLHRRDEWDEEEDEVEGLVDQRIFTLLQPWDGLWRLRRHMTHDPIGFRPFEGADTVTALARSITVKRASPTRVPPPLQVCWLIDAALRMVLEHEDLLKDVMGHASEAFRLHPGAEAGPARDAFLKAALGKMSVADALPGAAPILSTYAWRHSRRGETRPGVDLRQLLFVLLPAACAVIIAALSARRRMEIESLRDDCVQRDAHGGTFISCWIEKSLRRLDSVPVPISVVRAVEALAWLSAEVRAERGERWLFAFRDPGTAGRNVHFDMTEALASFADYVGVPPLPDGSRWAFTAQQFRSFFATVYYHRFHYPSLTALSHHLRHGNPDTTRGYVTTRVRGDYLRLADEAEASREARGSAFRAWKSQRERARDFEGGRRDFLLRTAREAAIGEVPIAGHGGDLWTKELAGLVDRAGRAATFAKPGSGDSLDELLRAWIEGKSLEPHPSGHSFCKCGPGTVDLAAAACLGVKRELEGPAAGAARAPDHAYAADETCSACPHNVQLPGNKPYWDERLEEAEAAAERCATGRQRDAAAERRDRIREHLGRCFAVRPEDAGHG